MTEPTIRPMEMNEEFELTAAEALFEQAVSQDVEVATDRAEGRERQISARIQISHPVEQVWQILTDYDHLADFIPNLAKSRRLEHPQGGIRIEQIGTQALLRFRFCARVVLDMVEQFPYQLNFQMIEGDFKAFYGSWKLQPIALSTGKGTELCYTVSVLPPRTMPIVLIEQRLKNGLVLNLSAIRQRADELFSA